jgi:hypothetical protein
VTRRQQLHSLLCSPLFSAYSISATLVAQHTAAMRRLTSEAPADAPLTRVRAMDEAAMEGAVGASSGDEVEDGVGIGGGEEVEEGVGVGSADELEDGTDAGGELWPEEEEEAAAAGADEELAAAELGGGIELELSTAALLDAGTGLELGRAALELNEALMELAATGVVMLELAAELAEAAAEEDDATLTVAEDDACDGGVPPVQVPSWKVPVF